ERYDVHFILAHTHGLNHHQVAPAGVEHGGDIGGSARESTQRAARCHAADVNSGVSVMRLHANAVAKDRSPAEWTGRIDCNNADRLTLLAVLAGDLINQRALTRTGRASQAQ